MVSLEKTVSQELQDNIAKTLAPYLGLGNFEISVAARLNTDKRQTNETNYNPESRVERSVRVVKETGSSQNATPARPSASSRTSRPSRPALRPATSRSAANERREELTNYEVSTKTTSTVSEGYKIEKLTVAVVINRKRLARRRWATMPPPEAVDKQLKEIERLVESAAGIDAKRGDRITVSAVDFVQDGQPLEPVAGHRHRRAPAPPHRQHRQRRGHRGRRRAADLVRRAAGDAGDPGARSGEPVRRGAAALQRSLRGRRRAAGGAKVAGEPQPNLIADLTEQARAHAAEAARADDRLRRGAGRRHPQAVDARGARSMSAAPVASLPDRVRSAGDDAAVRRPSAGEARADGERRPPMIERRPCRGGETAAMDGGQARRAEARVELRASSPPSGSVRGRRGAESWAGRLAEQLASGLGEIEARLGRDRGRACSSRSSRAAAARQADRRPARRARRSADQDAGIAVMRISGPEDLLASAARAARRQAPDNVDLSAEPGRRARAAGQTDPRDAARRVDGSESRRRCGERDEEAKARSSSSSAAARAARRAATTAACGRSPTPTS